MSSSPHVRPTIKATLFVSIVALGLVLALGRPGLQANGTTPPRHGEAMQAPKDALIAMDVLLKPNPAITRKANALNARLRGGLSLPATSWMPRTRRTSPSFNG